MLSSGQTAAIAMTCQHLSVNLSIILMYVCTVYVVMYMQIPVIINIDISVKANMRWRRFLDMIRETGSSLINKDAIMFSADYVEGGKCGIAQSVGSA